ncbi:PQQ-binding-like beta-propeller repeat protein [Nocardiopsis sp. CC223A]|uniref:outer membrane protein assembly factor BamB family protein n=1 Tax=Nocardiopsis sp. CC223A TaxID=3044051 RepID=UPI00278BE7DC|nr:PQQ-binding-like beta-propeller repeat protein [Nocardiopsis sp. CC223A]
MAASACAVTPGPGEPAPDPVAEYLAETGYEPTVSDISPREHLLCTADGERAPDCDGRGQVRWSLPLEGEYRLIEWLTFYHPDTGAAHYDNASTFQAVEAGDGGVFYAENALLRMVDADTGELRWTTDLRRNPEADFLHSGLRSLHADTDRIVLRFADGLVEVDAAEGAVSGVVALPECAGDLTAVDGSRVVLEHCHDREGSYMALDLATGRTLWEFRQGDEADLSGGRLNTPSRVFTTEVDEGPASAVEVNPGWYGPAGLGTVALTRIGDTPQERGHTTVALACAPDGLGTLEPEPHAPGVRCAEPRLYAVNTG